MLKKITLENFMSHSFTEIDLEPGLNVLTGPNNCGKSALVAALQILANNGNTTHVIRHGKKFARVTATTDDGHTIVWQRKKSAVSYTIDGEEIHRIGQKTPDRLHPTLRLARVDTDDGKNQYDIHFGEQKSPVFLINESGNRAASFFASSSDAALLIEMQSLHRTRLKDKKREKKDLEKSIDENAGRLALLAPIPAISDRVAMAETLDDQLSASLATQREIAKSIEAMRSLQQEKKRLASLLDVLRELDNSSVTPETLRTGFDDVRSLRNHVGQLKNLTAFQRALIRRSDALVGLVDPPRLQPIERLRSWLADHNATRITQHLATTQIENLNTLESPPAMHSITAGRDFVLRHRSQVRLRTQTSARVNVLRQLCVQPVLSDTRLLTTRIAELRVLSSQREQLAQRYARLESLPVLESPRDTTRLSETARQLTEAIAAAESFREEFADVGRRMKDVEKDIRTFIKANPKCEACGAEMQPEQLLSAASSLHSHAPPSANGSPADAPAAARQIDDHDEVSS
jgi:exonuclease SbcC